MEDEYRRRLKEYEGRSTTAKALGALTVLGWVWAAWLVLAPAGGDCGSPAFYEPLGYHLQEVCDSQVIGRIGGAVAVVVLTLPLCAAWVWALGGLRVRREELGALFGR
ncbi:hypothetical protein ACIRD3_27515 [Kitasatospora sp. NPDC093550]|uniref:hypothetical protein n=1 Tax=Kitasatospora sp. NPDC093550 TaxID=3364089 RepID=UPI00380D5F05